jgi:hypothetical protein
MKHDARSKEDLQSETDFQKFIAEKTRNYEAAIFAATSL